MLRSDTFQECWNNRASLLPDPRGKIICYKLEQNQQNRVRHLDKRLILDTQTVLF